MSLNEYRRLRRPIGAHMLWFMFPSLRRRSKARRSAVVLGLSPTGLSAMRELAAAGFAVLGVSDELAPGLWSRRATLGTWRSGAPDRLVERLAAFARDQDEPPLLFPTSDGYVELVIRNVDELSGFRSQASYGDGTAAALLDKERFYALCDTHGLDQPRRATLHDRREALRWLQEATPSVPFPAILKPAEIHRVKHFMRGRKVIVVRDPSELAAALQDLPFDSTSWLLQEVVPGPDSELLMFGAYIDRTGRPARVVTARKLRQYPIGFGTATLARSEPEAEVRATSLAFLDAIGFRGITEVEFKRDARDGRLRIMEINPRPELWCQLARSAGVDILAAAADDLSGRPIGPGGEQRDGVRWRYGLKDAYAAANYRFRPSASLFPAPEVGSGPSHAAALWDPRDPLPGLAEPLLYLAKALRRGRRLTGASSAPPD